MKIIFAYTLIIYLHLITASISTEIKILYKINDSVITNYDISEEVNYLVSLNRNLNQLNDKQLFSNAEKSLIREIIIKN